MKSICLLIVLKLTLLLNRECNCQIQSFTEEPKNRSVLVGGEAILNCIVKNQQGEVTWCKDGFCTFGRNRNYTDKRLTLIGDVSKGENNLLIKNASINDNVPFQCQVTSSDKSPAIQSNLAYLTVLIKPTTVKIITNVKNNNSSVKLIMKQNSNIECVVEDSNPAVDFNWYLDNQVLTVGGDIIEISKKADRTSNKLFKTIGKLTVKVDSDPKWHNKEIKCEAYNEGTKLLNEVFSDTKTTLVHYAPIMSIIKLTSTEVIADEFIQFECSADARPQVTNYKWYIDAKTYSTGADEKYLTLKIESSMHKKLLKCDATNEVSTQTSSFLFDVNYGPKFSKKLPSHRLISLYEKLTLLCEVDSNPIASVFWKLNGSLVYAYPNFTIDSMQPFNYGTYTREASLKDFPTISSSIKVIPPGPPIIEADLVQYSFVGYEGIVECITEAEPKAENILWYKEGILINLKDTFKYRVSSHELPSKGIKHRLTIFSASQEDFKNYTFTASNKYGESKITIDLQPKANTIESSLILVSTVAIIFLVFIIIGSCVLFRYFKLRDVKKKKIKKLKQKIQMKRLLKTDQNSKQARPPLYNQYVNFSQQQLPQEVDLFDTSFRTSSELLFSNNSSNYEHNPHTYASYYSEPYELINSRKQTPEHNSADNLSYRISRYQTDV